MSNFTFSEDFRSDSSIKYRAFQDGHMLNNLEVMNALKEQVGFRKAFSALLADCPFKGIFWECAPMALVNQEEAFEFVLLDSPTIAQLQAFDGPFQAPFRAEPDPSIAVFQNLGKDATLIAPKAQEPGDQFAHLLQFIRTATSEQIDQFWGRVGEAMLEVLNQEPTWMSTSGLGVYWLHVRLDTRPKYYQYQPYRKWDI
ncbi:MAG: hypothetical protein AAF598_06300 [Bacteroidota bacterium]